jgi:glycine/D-amino acid oxidase-like deaminating enzyme
MDADILVIGAGLVGACIANRLAGDGLRVAVVDAGGIGQGATRRAAGLATPRLTSEHLADTARGTDAITNMALRLGVVPRACRVLHLTSKPADVDALRERLDALNGATANPKLTWETEPGLVPEGFGGGILVHQSALIDPVALTTKLLQHSNIAVQENVEIQSLEWHGATLTALSQDHTIRASAAVLATNAYAGTLSPYLADAVDVVRGIMWSSHPLERESVLLERMLHVAPMPLVIDRAHLLVTQTVDWRLRINAWHWDNHNNDDPAEDVQRFLRAHLPELLEYTEEWRSGTTTVTHDGAPLVGRLAGEGRVFYALGAGMFGPAWAPIMAEQVAELVKE